MKRPDVPAPLLVLLSITSVQFGSASRARSSTTWARPG
jgi:hypothetical protein